MTSLEGAQGLLIHFQLIEYSKSGYVISEISYEWQRLQLAHPFLSSHAFTLMKPLAKREAHMARGEGDL